MTYFGALLSSPSWGFSAFIERLDGLWMAERRCIRPGLSA